MRVLGPVVRALAKRHARGDHELEADLAQEGYIAGLLAFDSYRDDRGASFVTHAWGRIHWHLSRRALVARRGGLTGDWRLSSLGAFTSFDAPHARPGHDADDDDAGTLYDVTPTSRPWALPVVLAEPAPAPAPTKRRRQRTKAEREAIMLTHNGETKSLTEWCATLGLDMRVVSARLRRGWGHSLAMTAPGARRRAA